MEKHPWAVCVRAAHIALSAELAVALEAQGLRNSELHIEVCELACFYVGRMRCGGLGLGM
eukprot:2092597-Alexandrium_andersonii.AAC.1